MATIEVTRDTLKVHVTGLDRLRMWTGNVSIPLEHVERVEYDPQETQRELNAFWTETYIPGTHLPGGSLAGSYSEHGQRVFWDVHHPDHAVTIHLSHDKFDKVIVEVRNPEEMVQTIKAALGREVAGARR
ncbi:MAG: hypothetical protein M1118_06965 [Chloroflexi bacterium]|nr:hypothetical protein [Chloroflexota bacterium]